MTLGREHRAAIRAFARRLRGLAVVEGEGGGDEFSAIGAIDERRIHSNSSSDIPRCFDRLEHSV